MLFKPVQRACNERLAVKTELADLQLKVTVPGVRRRDGIRTSTKYAEKSTL